MNSLLQSQIRESCKLSLPEGLKDLMSDISREVLRAQPQNVYQFIAHYLEALLEVRESLSIACHLCNEACACTCEPELQNELRTMGLGEEDVTRAVEIIQEHFKSGAVNEPSLFIKLVKKTSIDEFYIPAIQETVQRAFKRQQLNNTKTKYLQNNDYDETTKAIQHTMHTYETSKPKPKELSVSTHVKPCAKHVSSTSSAEYKEITEFQHDCDFDNSSESPKEQYLSLNSTTDDIEKDFENIKDRVDINSENGVSDSNDEIDHSEYVVDDCDKVKDEDIVTEEIDENRESGNDSIVSSVDESLLNTDEQVF